MKLTDYTPPMYADHKDKINSLIIERACERAEIRLQEAAYPDDVTEAAAGNEGEEIHYKRKYQSEFDGYYDKEYDRIASEMGFDNNAEDGIMDKE